MIEVVLIAIPIAVLLIGFGGHAYLSRKKLKPIPRPNRVPYDSKTFRK